jgi:hypothetical protein
MAAAKTMVATTHFSYADDDGNEVFVHSGERFASTHPVVKRYPDSFQGRAGRRQTPGTKEQQDMTMYRALASFPYEDDDGELTYFEKGKTRVSPDHPVLRDTRHLFEAVTTGPGSSNRTACRALDATGRLLEER